MEDLRELEEKLRRETDEHIEELLGLLECANPLDFASQYALHNLVGPIEKATQHDRSESRVEYLISLIQSRNFSTELRHPSPPEIQRCFDLIEYIFSKAAFCYSALKRSHSDEPEAELATLLRIDTLAVRGDGFYPHMRERFGAILNPMSSALIREIGFDFASFEAFLERIEEHLLANLERERLTRIVPFQQALRALAKEFATANTILDSSSRHQAIARITDPNDPEFLKIKEDFDLFGMSELFIVEPTTSAELKILELLSCTPGENGDFISSIQFRGWPLNPSSFPRRPLLKIGSSFYLFHLQFLGRSAFRLFREIVEETSPGTAKQLLKARDGYTEKRAIELLSGALPGCRHFHNLTYSTMSEKGNLRYEVDGVIACDDVLLIVEAKARGLSSAGRRGAPSAIEDLKKSIGNASAQATRFRKALDNEGYINCFHSNGELALAVDRSSFHFIVEVVVTFDLFPVATGRLPLLKALGVIEGDIWPWVICLDDLRVITEILDRPSILLHYLKRRIRLNQFPKFQSHDELEYMTAYLENGLYLDHDSRFQDADFVSLIGYTKELEFYYAREAGFRPKGKKPRARLSPRMKLFLDVLQSKKRQHYLTASIFMLECDLKFREEFFDSWTERIERNRRTGIATFVYLSPKEENENCMLGICFVENLRSWSDSIERRCRDETMRQHEVQRLILIIVEPPFVAGKHEIRVLEKNS